MKTLSKITKNIRSKNAGPFWITVDLFFKDKNSFFYACKNISNEEILNILKIKKNKLKRFDISSLNVIKFSFARKHIQGSRLDRDMHGASFSVLFENLKLWFTLHRLLNFRFLLFYKISYLSNATNPKFFICSWWLISSKIVAFV